MSDHEIAESQNPDEPIPGTVFTPRQVKFLKVAVIVMSIILVGGFALVLATIFYQASTYGESGRAASIEATEGVLRIEPGQSVSHISLDGNRLAVHSQGPAGSEITVIDIRSGAVISRIAIGGK